MEARINKWGNSAAVRLPASVLTSMGLELNSPITIDVIEGKIIIAPVDNSRKRFELPFSEEFLLENLDAHNAHADELAVLHASEFDQ
jgi:Growth regulator